MSSQLPEQLVQLLRGHRGLLQQGRKILGALVDVSRDRRSPGGNALEVARHVPDIREDLAGLPKQSGKAGLAVPDLTHDRADIGAGAFQLSQDPPDLLDTLVGGRNRRLEVAHQGVVADNTADIAFSALDASRYFGQRMSDAAEVGHDRKNLLAGLVDQSADIVGRGALGRRLDDREIANPLPRPNRA